MLYRYPENEPEEQEAISFWRLVIELYKSYRRNDAFYIVLRKRRDGWYSIEEQATLKIDHKI